MMRNKGREAIIMQMLMQINRPTNKRPGPNIERYGSTDMDLDIPEISKPKGLDSSSLHGSCNYLRVPTYLMQLYRK